MIRYPPLPSLVPTYQDLCQSIEKGLERGGFWESDVIPEWARVMSMIMEWDKEYSGSEEFMDSSYTLDRRLFQLGKQEIDVGPTLDDPENNEVEAGRLEDFANALRDAKRSRSTSQMMLLEY